MLPHFHRKVLKERQRKLIERFEDIEHLVSNNAISQQEADYLLEREFGGSVHDQLEHVKGHLSKDFAVRASLSLLGVFLTLGLLFGSATGFAVSGFPISQDLRMVFTDSYTVALPIAHDIDSLSISATYTGSGTYSVLLTNPSQSYLVASGSDSVLDYECMDSCEVVSSGPYSLQVTMSSGVFDLSQIQYTKK